MKKITHNISRERAKIITKPLLLMLLFSLSFVAAKAECRRDTMYFYSFSLYDLERYTESRAINTYDANNNLLEYLGQGWNSTSKKWEDGNKKTYTYDGNNNLLTEIHARWSSAWFNEKKYIRTYDLNKNKLTELYQSWNSTTSAWTDALKTDWTYTANNQILVQTSYTWNTTTAAWVGNSRSTYSYDGNGNNTVLLAEGWVKTKNKWGASTKYTNTYVGNNLSVMLYQLADTNGNFKDRQKFVFTYDANNNAIDQTTYFGSGNLVISGKYLYQYDASNNRIQEIKQRYFTSNSTYENLSKTQYLFNSNKIKIAEYYETWDVGKAAWLKTSRDSFEVNVDNDIKALDRKYNYSYFYNVYAAHTSEEYVCTHIANTSNTKLLPSKSEVGVYPNPIQSDNFFVNVNQNSNYVLLDLQGKTVQTGSLKNGSNEVELRSNLSNGIYFIKIGKLTQKIVVNK